MAGKAARAFPTARVLVLSGVGHVAMMERPDLVSAEIKSVPGWVQASGGPAVAAKRIAEETASNQVPGWGVPAATAGCEASRAHRRVLGHSRDSGRRRPGKVLAPGYVACEARGGHRGSARGPARRARHRASQRSPRSPGPSICRSTAYFGVEFGDAEPDGWAKVARRLPETGTTGVPADVHHKPARRTRPPRCARPRSSRRAAAGRRPGARRAPGGPVHRREQGAARTTGPGSSNQTRSDRQAARGRAGPRAGRHAGSGGARRHGRDRAAQRGGVRVSVGHCDATAAQVGAAATAGARMVTHLFNGQRPMHHREPGVAGQALADPPADQRADRATCGTWPAEVCAMAFRRRPGPDLPGHRRGGVRRHAARPLPARRRADRAAAGRRGPAGARRRHAGRVRAAHGRGGGEHGRGRDRPGRRGRRRHPRSPPT